MKKTVENKIGPPLIFIDAKSYHCYIKFNGFCSFFLFAFWIPHNSEKSRSFIKNLISSNSYEFLNFK